MRILALIPARGGSKRLPGKNSIDLGGKPLINWSIEITKEIEDICSTLVSTDDENIAQIALKSGAIVPWLRPAILSQDESSSSDVAIHALDWYESQFGKVDGLMLLQPTSPFRSKATILAAIALFKASNCEPIIGVSKSKDQNSQRYKLQNGIITQVEEGNVKNKLHKLLGKLYKINGSVYLINPVELRLCRSFQPKNALGLKIKSQKESIDIDTEDDLSQARKALAR
jgi:CMP-N,N'-diacetyllegionaminic acid synthase